MRSKAFCQGVGALLFVGGPPMTAEHEARDELQVGRLVQDAGQLIDPLPVVGTGPAQHVERAHAQGVDESLGLRHGCRLGKAGADQGGDLDAAHRLVERSDRAVG